jgi:hypothetical protein
MVKNILIFADGTGNEGGLLPDESRTNVYKLFRATRVDPDSEINPSEQIAFTFPALGRRAQVTHRSGEGCMRPFSKWSEAASPKRSPTVTLQS